ncbi:MAG: hypothetical protein CMP57_03960 [Flavobacteriales bacterium]|nr:hypothetical protein [Flavobacteriales bacterium]|tara:strand:+ start:784 stop:1302 length:519 start_codon:yes stop_codon:yes gene_type:complete
MKIFITGNMQLGRPSAIGKWRRPFDDVDQMTETLVKNWNSTVGDEDIVYHLGNFAWDPKTAYDCLLKLKGKRIFMMLGENDEALSELHSKGTLQERVKIIGDIFLEKNIDSILSYWPMAEWYNKKKDFYQITGYPNRKHKTAPKKKIINCSTDQCNFKPQDINSLLDLLSEL